MTHRAPGELEELRLRHAALTAQHAKAKAARADELDAAVARATAARDAAPAVPAPSREVGAVRSGGR